MSKYNELATFIIKNIGGKDNIVNITHCMTRLRIKLKDKELANKEALESNSGIISCQEAEGKLQVIIGTHVGDVYEEIISQTGGYNKEVEEEKGSLINRFAATITKIVVPALGVLMACGIISGINSVLLSTGVITTDSGTYVILNAMGNACLTFFPVILGYTSALAFGMDPFVGAIIGAVLIFPNIVTDINSGDVLFTLLEGTPFAMPVYKTFFGIPIIFPATGYTSTLIPIMLINYFASKVEKGLKNSLPALLQQFMVPFVTILVAGVIGVLAIGPISMLLQNGLQAGLEWLISISKILAFAVITLIYQPLVIFGLHWPLITLGIMEFATSGCSLIVASIFPASFTHMAACLAVFLKTKSAKMKGIALPAFLSACFCIIEPSIYGVTLPVKKRFAYCMAGGLVGGLIIALANAPMYAVSMGVTGFMAFINPAVSGFSGLFWCVVACVAAMAVTFALTWLSFKQGEDGKNEDDIVYESHKNITHKKEVISSPVKGSIQSLSSVNDEVFSKGDLGKGVCIIPEDGKIVAPCDGKIEVLYPTGHAVCIKSNSGAEVLIHVGINTFEVKENIFKKLKNQGDSVKKGDVIIEVDLAKMKELGLSTETMVTITNTNDYLDVIGTKKDRVQYEDDLLVTLVSEV